MIARCQAKGRPFSETKALVDEMDRRVDPSRQDDFNEAVGNRALTHVLFRNPDVIADLANAPVPQEELKTLLLATKQVQQSFLDLIGERAASHEDARHPLVFWVHLGDDAIWEVEPPSSVPPASERPGVNRLVPKSEKMRS